MSQEAMQRSRALWNRHRLDLRSEETLAQLLEHGELAAGRELYAVARADAALRERLCRVVRRVPLSLGHFWRSALASLGADVDVSEPLPAFRLDV